MANEGSVFPGTDIYAIQGDGEGDNNEITKKPTGIGTIRIGDMIGTEYRGLNPKFPESEGSDDEVDMTIDGICRRIGGGIL